MKCGKPRAYMRRKKSVCGGVASIIVAFYLISHFIIIEVGLVT